MKYQIHRGWIRNLLTGREIFARKLVVEDEILFTEGRRTVRVDVVAYSGEDVAHVTFVDYNRGVVTEIVANPPVAGPFAAADMGEGPLRLYLFRLWEMHGGV